MKIVLLVAAATLASFAAAQPVKNTPGPADPAASVPPLTYESAFARYTPTREIEIADWRVLNATVGTVGGHTGQVRPARSPKTPPRPVKGSGR